MHEGVKHAGQLSGDGQLATRKIIGLRIGAIERLELQLHILYCAIDYGAIGLIVSATREHVLQRVTPHHRVVMRSTIVRNLCVPEASSEQAPVHNFDDYLPPIQNTGIVSTVEIGPRFDS